MITEHDMENEICDAIKKAYEHAERIADGPTRSAMRWGVAHSMAAICHEMWPGRDCVKLFERAGMDAYVHESATRAYWQHINLP